jgi:hypothetical protein
VGLGHILRELDRLGDTSLRGADVGRREFLMPETSSNPSFNLCSLSDPVGVLVVCFPSRVLRDDLGLSSSGSPVAALPFSQSWLPKRTCWLVAPGRSASPCSRGSDLVSTALPR